MAPMNFAEIPRADRGVGRHSQEAQGSVSFSDSFVEVDGCRTHLRRGGKGEPLLFLHGASGAPAIMPFMEKLAQRFDVLVPEHPGYGQSDEPEWLENIHDVAYFYLDFLKQLDSAGRHAGRQLAWAAGSRWRWRCATPRASSRWCSSAPPASPRPACCRRTSSSWRPKSWCGNLFVDAEARRGAPRRAADAGAIDVGAQEPPHHRAPRLGAAPARSAPAEVAAPHRRAGEDHLGRAGPHPAGGLRRRIQAAACPKAQIHDHARTAATCRTPRRPTSSSTSYAKA